MFEISHSSDQSLKVGCAEPKEFQDWIVELNNATKEAVTRNQKNMVIQKKFQIAKEFSDLVIYCRSTPYHPEGRDVLCLL